MARASKLKSLIFPVILILIAISLAYLNFSPNTWLSGWDNLMPELDIKLNIWRSLSVAWQQYQGLGLLGGMAHAADLPRQIVILGLMNLGTNPHLIRYLWTFAMLALGPLGMYLLAENTLLRKFDLQTRRLAAFFTGLFYLLNLATVQNFYTPFEAFTSFYGFFPWLLLANIFYLRFPRRRHAMMLVVIHLLAAPAFYVQTLFVVYAMCLGLVWIAYLINNRFRRHALSTLLFSGLMILFASAYWLFPAGYYALTSAKTTTQAVQNQVATREVIERNAEYGTLDNVTLLKGFWFDYVDLGKNNQFALMMDPWIKHLANPVVTGVGYAFFAIILGGLFFAFRRQLHDRLVVTGIFLLSLFFLINLNPPTEFLFRAMENLPVLREVFRSVFTKWSVPAEASFALFFGVGVIFLLDLFSSLSFRLTALITTFTLGLAFLIFTAPAFSGQLIYDPMRTAIPQDYFDLFAYLDKADPAGRIANFPQNTFWGWQFYDWGYRGSGYLWYGIRQPILDRAFDVWSGYSQQYFQEARLALYRQSEPNLERVLEKYSVSYVLVDNSIVVPGVTDASSLYLPQLKRLLEQDPNTKLVKSFGKLDLWENQLQGKPKTFLDTQTVDIPSQGATYPSQIFYPTFDKPLQNHSQLKEATNCDNFNADFFTRTVSQDQILYQARNASSCDHFVYKNVPHDRPYQLIIRHKNLNGEPFFICLEDHVTHQCELFQYLPKSSDWTTTTLEIPRLNPTDSGFTLHLYDYSIGNVLTTNAWSDISLKAESDKAQPEITTNKPLAQVTKIDHPTTALYALKVTPSQEDARLVLNQAYDPNWKAYALQADTASYLSPLFLSPLPESRHEQAKGWANGWVLPPGTKSVVLYYTPQTWQYLGFGLMLLLPILVLAHKKEDR